MFAASSVWHLNHLLKQLFQTQSNELKHGVKVQYVKEVAYSNEDVFSWLKNRKPWKEERDPKAEKKDSYEERLDFAQYCGKVIIVTLIEDLKWGEDRNCSELERGIHLCEEEIKVK